jgi:hypothetical protein
MVMPADPYENNPERTCLACGQKDKGPRDVVGLPDGGTANYHFDCHVLTHDCAVCKEVLAALGTDATGKGLKNEKLLGAVLGEMKKPESERASIFIKDNASEDRDVVLYGENGGNE